MRGSLTLFRKKWLQERGQHDCRGRRGKMIRPKEFRVSPYLNVASSQYGLQWDIALAFPSNSLSMKSVKHCRRSSELLGSGALNVLLHATRPSPVNVRAPTCILTTLLPLTNVKLT